MCTAKLAFKFLPTRESFIQSLGVSPGADVQVELQGFVTAFSPVLAQIHQFLVSFVWESSIKWQDLHVLREPVRVRYTYFICPSQELHSTFRAGRQQPG